MSEQEEKESKTVEYIFKIAVLAITLWAIPITKTVYNNHAELYVGPRFTAQQGAQVEQRLGLVEHKVDSLEIPPPWLLDIRASQCHAYRTEKDLGRMGDSEWQRRKSQLSQTSGFQPWLRQGLVISIRFTSRLEFMIFRGFLA